MEKIQDMDELVPTTTLKSQLDIIDLEIIKKCYRLGFWVFFCFFHLYIREFRRELSFHHITKKPCVVCNEGFSSAQITNWTNKIKVIDFNKNVLSCEQTVQYCIIAAMND
jgi:hypothetical protein